MAEDTDRIERRITLRAPRARVWRAIGDAAVFGQWFGVVFDGPFVAGERVRGRIVDPPGMDALPFEVAVEAVEHERLLAFRWHPYAIDPTVDYTGEEPTRVEMRLDDAPDGGTLLVVVESGFDRIWPHRRAEAFEMNGRGWAIQLDRVARHVGG